MTALADVDFDAEREASPSLTPSARLSQRQAEFLAMAGNGMSAPQIGRRVFLSHWTVKGELEEARYRLAVRTTMQAVMKAVALEMLILDHEGRVHAPSPRPVETTSF